MTQLRRSFKTLVFNSFASGLLLAALSAMQVSSAGAQTQKLSGADARKLATTFEEPLIPTGPSSPSEDASLLAAIRSYDLQTAQDDLTVFSSFLSQYPDSVYRVSLLTNLGLAYYRYGYFSKAINVWEQAWEAGKDLKEPHQKAMVDRAIGELIRMHARLGHADELEALMKEVGTRGLTGPATEEIDGGKEGLWMMRNDPGVAYLCGPAALKNLLLAQGAKSERIQFLDSYRSGPHGVTLEQVAGLADKAGLSYRLVFRRGGQPVPVPSIVHWKLSHFAAIVDRKGDIFHIVDPTFGSDLWISARALDEETSGYYLVPSTVATADWRPVPLDEARQVRGMGYTLSNWPFATTVFDTYCEECERKRKARSGLAAYKFSEMLVSLNISDTPVGYAPPKGPSMLVTLTYNQREATQPSNFTYFNLGPKWSLNWLSYVEDDPTRLGQNVVRAMAGGGGVQELNAQNGVFPPEPWDASVLTLASADPIVYTRQLPTGGIETYAQSDGTTHAGRRIFLSKLTDPAGNTVTLNYDGQLRLSSITDATGRDTRFAYNNPTDSLLVTDITDPFQRTAHLSYNPAGELASITDVIGMTSQFSYDNSGLVNVLTTPYGNTTFSYGDNGNQRFLQATDPVGHTERVEYYQGAPGIPSSDPPALVPVGLKNPFNAYLNDRDTFYWDEHAYALANGDYTKARNRHWTHLSTSTTLTADTIESVKFPYESRIWYSYPGQTSGGFSGSFNSPSQTGRVITEVEATSNDALGVTRSTQLSQTSYNSAGHPTSDIDAVGRTTGYTYADNQIDLTSVVQQIGSGSSAIARYTYNSQHLPLTYTDAAGQVTRYAYNAAGQLTQLTDALGEMTSYQYDSLGYLQTITDANRKTLSSFTYDQFGRVATATDSEGYTVQYSYDALDRITRETYPDATTREYIWTNLDLTRAKDRQGRITQYNYDGVRNLIDVTDPLDRHTRFDYWENGKLKSLTDPDGNTTTWAVDLEGRVTSKHYADGSRVGYAYEGSINRLRTVTDALGQTKRYRYNLDDTVKAIDYLRAINATPNVALTYDPYFRRVAAMADGTGTTQYQYFPPGVLGALQLQNETGPFLNAMIAYQYDKLGRLASRTVDSSTERFTYDSLGRVVSDANDLGSFTMAYLGETSQITSRLLQGTTIATGWVYDTNQNDRRLKAINNSNATRSFNFTTTPEDLISQIQESEPNGGQWPPQTWNYQYDDSSRLLRALGTSSQFMYSYDSTDNITSFQGPWGSRGASYNSLNEITSLNNQSYLYDANGNLLDDGARHYVWDAENRLISVTSIGTGQTTTFRYDGRSRRISMMTSGSGTSGNYLWCGNTLCQARSLSDNVLRHYFSEGEYVLAGMQGLYYSQDQLGSIRDVLARDGSRDAASDYEPYGSTVQTSSGNLTDFRYAGLFYEQQDGLYLATYRAFDGVSGRFINRDPIREDGGLNLYGYVDSNPTNAVDRDGLYDLDDFEIDSLQAWAGFSDVLTFGVTRWARETLGTEYSDPCSAAYQAGEWGGLAASIASGGLAGLEAAGTKGAGLEFSHWIPNRLGGPRSLWNGNFVTAEEHALSDPYRYRFMPRSWKMENPMPDPLVQQFNRIPNVYKGAGAGAARGEAGMQGCGCNQ